MAIFDADFVPAPDFLRRTVPHFRDPGLGLVQARWGHLNRDAVAADPRPGDAARRALRHRAHRPQPLGPLLQLQRHRRHLATQLHRGRRRLAARHADRGPRSVLSRPAPGLALRLPQRRARPRRAAGRDERLQEPAAPLGQGLDPDRAQAAAGPPRPAPAHTSQARSRGPPDRQRRLPVDDRPGRCSWCRRSGSAARSRRSCCYTSICR